MNREHYFQEDERRAWIAIKAVPGLGEVRIKSLVVEVGLAAKIFSARPDTLMKVEGIGIALMKEIRSFQPDRESIDRELARVDKLGYQIVPLGAPVFPEALYALDGPPTLLYIRGDLRSGDRWSMAVVGSRKATDYGRRMTEILSGGLAEKGFTIVSGMAWGIDQTAHRSAILAGGRTIGVLGCGLDVVYPAKQNDLRNAVAENGALITEFPLGTPPEPKNFPQRNRIISGLSMGTVVVEAAQRSGSLITARLALGQGREVFSVPGRAGDQGNAGTNFLIKQGAKLVENLEDILEEFPLASLPPEGPPAASRGASSDYFPMGLSDEEQLVYKGLSKDPRHIDALTVENKFSSSRISGVLLQLELKGIARQIAGNFFVRAD